MNFSLLWDNLRRTIRYRLIWLVLACVLPVWLAAGFLVAFVYQEKKGAIEANMLATARGMVQVADRELDNATASLVALATSPALDQRDFPAFHRQAKELLRSYEGADIVLADSTGQQLVNTYRAPGTPLPKRAISSAVRRIFEEGKPGVSGLFKGALTGRHLIGVDVPVTRGGAVLFDLAMTMPVDRIAAILQAQPLPAGWVGLIMDDSRTVVSRTLYPERHVGTRIPPLMGLAPGQMERTREFVSLDNVRALAAISKSPFSGWAVVIHVPLGIVQAELENWVRWVTAGTLLLSLLGVALALGIGRGIGSAVQSLIPPALDLAEGKLVSPPKSGLKEIDSVAEALGAASGLLKDMTDDLRRSNRELEEFAAVASHDLQEPLRKISAFGERLRENHAQALDEQGLDFLRRMESATERMQHLIQDLLEYSRVTTRPNPFVRTDLGELVRDVLADLEGAVAETGAEVTVGELPQAEVDASQMRRVFQNLLSNALKYRRPSIPPQVGVTGRVVLEDGTELAEITVSDNGIGFEDQFAEKIFQPFQRLHGRNKYPGTGIGLAIVRKSVERHGGTVSARSAPGEGSFFIISIPLKQLQASA
ncbi:sensor histidine kinase [Fundidesulfovibrio agrisoli]|uniref:sensor histidine kinase n=1 Tax=Fundidesulfovibrio agrisoli TaxID=2922717 RepID=UPI001FADC618|nr:sensor histidine kinase [Fundidesulfovibrio agrisoli]